MKKPEEFQWCAERLKALADPERLRILTVLLTGPRNVSALADELDDAIVKVSHHLGVLRHSGIVRTTKHGRHVEYAVAPDVFAVANVSDEGSYLDLGCCRLELPIDKSFRRRHG